MRSMQGHKSCSAPTTTRSDLLAAIGQHTGTRRQASAVAGCSTMSHDASSSAHWPVTGPDAGATGVRRSVPEEIRVLHVDDQADFTALSARFLPIADERIEVIQEADPHFALGRLRGSDASFDCVVSDYEMPSMDGKEFFKAVRRDIGPIPFIFYSSYDIQEFTEYADRSEMTSYIPKGGQQQFEKLADRIVATVEEEVR